MFHSQPHQFQSNCLQTDIRVSVYVSSSFWSAYSDLLLICWTGTTIEYSINVLLLGSIGKFGELSRPEQPLYVRYVDLLKAAEAVTVVR